MAALPLGVFAMPAMAGNINIGFGRGEMPTATMSTEGGARAEVYIAGAHVTSWTTTSGEEQLFLSSASEYGRGCAIRGGIPVCFPQFSGRGNLAKHGFARTSWEWEIESMRSEGGVCRLVLCLCDNEATREVWPHKFKLKYTVTLDDERLVTQMEVHNLGAEAFEFTAALHTYFCVPDVTAISVGGLGGLCYEDNADGGAVHTEQAVDLVTLQGEVDRVYLDAPAEILIRSPGRRTIRLVKRGFRDVVLWNLGDAKAPGMTDLGEGEWRRYVCVEAGAIGTPVRLEPSAEYVASQELNTLQ